MMLFRQGNETAAKALFQEAAAQMPPLPENAAHLLPVDVDQRQFATISWPKSGNNFSLSRGGGAKPRFGPG